MSTPQNIPSARKTSVSGATVGSCSPTNYHDLDLYPRLLREFENHRIPEAEQMSYATSPPANWDLYPALLRQVENNGQQLQPDMLQNWEFRSIYKE
ncbi:hypothetical protein K493DRAFT_319602 [Basidiobolus meristosporus CBS 931.73]|uniref:Uncharacterized protein n=1 Tax=Basidiobolus meristosporus CBS 931.73 TaxID=1314790 RepID=A0A1Y1XQ04_9FUNG|nr:hypothetical protein K493DRAFT_319602 [Basidiobolus meristosporus CBS 931.73]|eukprot:ORX87839.1 hypothetical protein K493DRAFT_319602 [Basidiobolus meristosporus CBS 931.73]